MSTIEIGQLLAASPKLNFFSKDTMKAQNSEQVGWNLSRRNSKRQKPNPASRVSTL